MSNWISVNERLPEFRVPVFAGFYRDREFIWWIFERYDEDEGWCWARYEGGLESDAYADEYDITHWQPLFEEPKAVPEGFVVFIGNFDNDVLTTIRNFDG